MNPLLDQDEGVLGGTDGTDGPARELVLAIEGEALTGGGVGVAYLNVDGIASSSGKATTP